MIEISDNTEILADLIFDHIKETSTLTLVSFMIIADWLEG